MGEIDRDPKSVIVVTEQDVSLAEYFKSLGIVTPEAQPSPNGQHTVPEEFQEKEDLDGAGDEGGDDWDEDAGAGVGSEKRRESLMIENFSTAAGSGDRDNGDRSGGSGRFAPSRKFGVVGKYSPNKFMGGVTKRSTHIKPYLEAYNRYTTAERRRLRGDPVSTARVYLRCI